MGLVKGVDSFIAGLNTFTERRLMFINCFMRFNKNSKIICLARKMKIKLIEARVKRKSLQHVALHDPSVELIKQEETMTQKVLNFCANLLFFEHPM